MSTSLESRHVQLKQIDGEGEYQISKDPNEKYGYNGRCLTWPGDYFVVGAPFALPSQLIEHLIASFPEMQRLIFKPANFREGSLSVVELDYSPGVMRYDDTWEGDNGYIDFDGHVSSFTCKRERSRKHNSQDHFWFGMQDRGSLRIIKNKLEFTSPRYRDGRLSISTFGHTGTDEYKGSMAGFIKIYGSRPGELIAASLEFIREFIKEQSYPIWRQ